MDPDVGLPGEFPFARGVYPAMYRDRLWQMRLYSGFGDAESTNERWRFLIAHGNNGVSAAFDLPTQCGLDSDAPGVAPEVGRVGVAVDCVRDFERLFAGLPADKIGISLNAHSTAPMVLALFLVAMERRGLTPGEINGSMTTDVLKDYVARGTWIFPPAAGIRLVGDVLEYCNKEMPRFYPLVIRGPDMRDAGASAVQEVAFAFANAVAYLEHAHGAGPRHRQDRPPPVRAVLLLRRLPPGGRQDPGGPTDLGPHADRAVRRAASLLDPAARDRLGRRHPLPGATSRRPTSSGARWAASAPSSAGARGCSSPGYDEAFDIPTEETARLALRTQQIVGYESDATATSDPLGGSYFVEQMTDDIEAAVLAIMADIARLGGAVAAIESGHMQREIASSAYRQEQDEQDGTKPIVATNLFVGDQEPAGAGRARPRQPGGRPADRDPAAVSAPLATSDEAQRRARGADRGRAGRTPT